jgi:TPR repeat protein
VAQDFTEAVSYYRLAAERGNARAQCSLGVCFQRGEGVAQDWVEAVRYYRLAVEQGNANAQYNLGACFQHGKGVAQDLTEAVSALKCVTIAPASSSAHAPSRYASWLAPMSAVQPYSSHTHPPI